MSPEFPVHTTLMIILMAFLIMGVPWLAVSETLPKVALSARVKRSIRWGSALALLALFIIRIVMGLIPGNENFLAPNLVLVFVAFIIALGTLPLMFSAAYRQVILAIPMAWLVAVHVLRLTGGYFLTLLDARLLPADFAISAGYGDVLVALFSLVVIYALSKGYPSARLLVIVWNILGFIDFGSALIGGGQYIPAFGAGLVAAGGSVQYLNFVLMIPAFIVPILAVVNIYTLFKLARGQKA